MSITFTIISQLYFPDGVSAADLLSRLVRKGVVVAGGLHTSIKGPFCVASRYPFTEAPTSQINTFALGSYGMLHRHD
jgi:hypothetical protein